MEALAGQPLEFNDFSGGMTDNFFQGDKTRYLKADNFDITVDKQLEERPGTLIYDSVGYTLEGTNSPGNRITGLYPVINQSVLLGLSSRSFYVQLQQDSAWTPIAGAGGNEALSAGNPYSQISSGEFQRQVFFTSDAGSRPAKLYRDSTNTWVAKTAGLPKLQGSSNYSESALLQKCIALANALRTSFINHINDWSGLSADPGNTWVSPTIQHKWRDLYSLSYFETVSFEGVFAYRYNLYLTVFGSDTALATAYANSFIPTVTPTPAPAATDEASLYTLCNALALAYENHRVDMTGQASNGVGSYKYHQLNTFRGAYGNIGIAAPLSQKTNPTTIADAAAFLDDFHTKHYWHMLSPYQHSSTGDYATMSRYIVSSSYKVGTVTSGEPLVTPNYGPFIDMAIYLRRAYNDHTQNVSGAGYQHFQRDQYYVTLPDPTDYDSACLTIFWCRLLYYYHYNDASFTNARTAITFTASAGSANLTAIADATSGSALTLTVGSWIGAWTPSYAGAVFTSTNPLDAYTAKVISSGSGTATVDRVAVAGVGAGNLGSAGPSYMHGTWANGARISSTSATKTTPSSQAITGGIYAYTAIGTTLKTWITLAQDFTQAFGYHDNDATIHKNAVFMGSRFTTTANSYLQNSASIPFVNGNAFYIPTADTYIYSFFYADSYVVETDGSTYLTRGNPVITSIISTCPSYPVGSTITSVDSTGLYQSTTITRQRECATITNITPLTNNPSTNYDVTNVTEEIYRTTSGGTVGYLLASVANGTTTYSDTTNDTLGNVAQPALNTNKPLYTNGGVLGSEQPPQAKYMHFLNGYMYYGAVLDTNGTLLENRLLQSTQYSPESVPGANALDLDDKLTGISSARNILIALCKSSVYRVEGNFDSTGKGFLNPQKISDEMGCLNTKSIVKTEIGTFFAGSDGFYYTDGYQLIKISLDLDKTYQKMTATDSQKACIYGAYDKDSRRVFWAMRSNPTSNANDVFFIYYLNYGVKPSGVFTTASAQYLQSWAPACCAYYKGKMVIGDEQGFLFKVDKDTKTDPKISYGSAPSTWSTLAIPYDFKSCSLNYGTIFKRKWITQVHLAGVNRGDIALQIQSIKDNNATGNGIQDLIPLQYHGNAVWGDPNFIWGDDTFKWKYDGDVDANRRFPAGSLRSDFRQIRFYPADITVYRSDSYPLGCFADVDATAKTATIQTPSGYTSILWPLDVVGMRICFDTDEYAQEFTITGLDATKKIITFSDDTNLSTTLAGRKWEIRGVKKGQRVRISSYVVHYGYLGDQVSAVQGNSDLSGEGSNA